MAQQTVPASLPRRQTAIIADNSGRLTISEEVLLPELAPDEVLIRTAVVALNPSDTKFTGGMATPGANAGSDLAGVVVAIGSAVTDSRLSVGDRVCAPAVPMDALAPRAGAFAQFVSVPADFVLLVPEGMPLEQAAGLGTGLATVGYALFKSLGIVERLDKPAAQAKFVLVHGGSAATGTLAIQLIRSSGCIPIATCSPHNFPLVQSRGAERAFDSRDPASAAAIRAYTGSALEYALDCVCSVASMEFCYAALGRFGGRYTTLEPFPEERTQQMRRHRVRPHWLLGVSLLGRRIGWKAPYGVDEPDPELRIFGAEWFRRVQAMLVRGEIQPHPVRLLKSKQGFEGVLEGVELLRKKAVSGEKLVQRILDATMTDKNENVTGHVAE